MTIGRKFCLAVHKDAEPDRFGTLLHMEGDWWIVAPFNEKMTRRALALGSDRATTVYR